MRRAVTRTGPAAMRPSRRDSRCARPAFAEVADGRVAVLQVTRHGKADSRQCHWIAATGVAHLDR